MNFEDFKYNDKNIPTDKRERQKFFDNEREKFLKEINDSELIKDAYECYTKESVKSFTELYITWKIHLADKYSYYLSQTEESLQLKYKEETEKTFNIIKQKILFNQQLLWRAEKIKIKEIKTSWDFYFWGNHIDSCPFLESVTDAQVAVLKQFLNDENFSDSPHLWITDWQYYDEYMEKNENGDYENMPRWYDFYDNRMGTGALLLLPNIRGQKEEHYMDIHKKHFQEELEKKRLESPPEEPPKKYYPSNDEVILNFAEDFEEDEHFIELFRIWKKTHEPKVSPYEIDEDTILMAIDSLLEADTKVMMPGGYDWREAIVRCARQYKNSVISSELDIIFEEYQMLQSMGISKGKGHDELWKLYEEDSLVKLGRDCLLDGRRLCGEPPDFDF